MFGKKTKSLICASLALGLICTGVSHGTMQAAAKAKLKTKSVKMTVGQKKKITIKNMNKKAVYRFTSSSKSKAVVSKKGVITAKKEGKATITVTEKYKKKTRKLGKVTVTVRAVPNTPPTEQTAVPQNTPAPQPVITPQPDTTPQPDNTQKPEETSGPMSVAEMEPISQYLEDTDYSVPDGFDRIDDSVAGVIEDITYDSTVIKEGEIVQRKAKVVLPKDYSEDKKYPVVYLNHGIFCDETTLCGPGSDVQNVIWNAIDEGVAEEMIAVFPNGCANEYNGPGIYDGFSVEHYSGYNNFINDLKECLMPYINEHYSTLTGRDYTAIGGFSMGGRVTLHIGFT
ncbi:MAG: Ig-like domain-containing protein, partial [Lachnospiraceae bacterium]|nr:Ig-like domain-containing protein [Lachnospiraceae bacterium]